MIDLTLSWSRDTAVIASDEGMHVWSLSRQEELSRISTDFKAFVSSVALSEDAKITVSGHGVGTVRRWNGHTGEYIGDPMSGQSGEVLSVAIRENLIVLGSDDGLWYRSNPTTGESIGSTLQGHGGSVICIAVRADGELIISNSLDGNIRRWDAGTGKSVGSD